jgi:hypothetical protein
MPPVVCYGQLVNAFAASLIGAGGFLFPNGNPGAFGMVETLNRSLGYLPNGLAAILIGLLVSLVSQVIGGVRREMTT